MRAKNAKIGSKVVFISGENKGQIGTIMGLSEDLKNCSVFITKRNIPVSAPLSSVNGVHKKPLEKTLTFGQRMALKRKLEKEAAK